MHTTRTHIGLAAERPRVFYGWTVLIVAAAAMVGTLPGRTQGLGLITEPLLADLGLDRVTYATLNFWATIIGAVGALGIGRLIDRFGSRVVLVCLSLSLGGVVCAMSQVASVPGVRRDQPGLGESQPLDRHHEAPAPVRVRHRVILSVRLDTTSDGGNTDRQT